MRLGCPRGIVDMRLGCRAWLRGLGFVAVACIGACALLACGSHRSAPRLGPPPEYEPPEDWDAGLSVNSVPKQPTSVRGEAGAGGAGAGDSGRSWGAPPDGRERDAAPPAPPRY